MQCERLLTYSTYYSKLPTFRRNQINRKREKSTCTLFFTLQSSAAFFTYKRWLLLTRTYLHARSTNLMNTADYSFALSGFRFTRATGIL